MRWHIRDDGTRTLYDGPVDNVMVYDYGTRYEIIASRHAPKRLSRLTLINSTLSETLRRAEQLFEDLKMPR